MAQDAGNPARKRLAPLSQLISQSIGHLREDAVKASHVTKRRRSHYEAAGRWFSLRS